MDEGIKYQLADLFRVEVHNKASEVDPQIEENWYSLTLGWAIGKGISPEDAHTFATYIRYKTDMG
jgi:hypothetical protein